MQQQHDKTACSHHQQHRHPCQHGSMGQVQVVPANHMQCCGAGRPAARPAAQPIHVIQRSHLLELPLAALISSSARHSAMVLMLRNALSRAPVVISQMAWLTRRSGDTSTAWRRTTPALPMRVASSRGPLHAGGRAWHPGHQHAAARGRTRNRNCCGSRLLRHAAASIASCAAVAAALHAVLCCAVLSWFRCDPHGANCALQAAYGIHTCTSSQRASCTYVLMSPTEQPAPLLLDCKTSIVAVAADIHRQAPNDRLGSSDTCCA